MFGIGLPELLLIFAMALIILGPDKLPQLARQIARQMGELKRASEKLKSELDIESLEEDLKNGIGTKSKSGWGDMINGDLSSERKVGDKSNAGNFDIQTEAVGKECNKAPSSNDKEKR